MRQEIPIREAGAEERQEIENLVKTVYREFQPLMPAAAWNGWMESISEAIHAADGVLLVAGDPGRIEGAVKFYPDAGQAHQGECPPGAASIRLLAVRSRQPGPGLRRPVDPGLPGPGPGAFTHHFPVHRELYDRSPSAL